MTRQDFYELLRAARVAIRTGVARDGLSPRAPRLLLRALRRGLSVRSLHALQAAVRPQAPAIIDAGEALTYAQADAEINRLANGLAALGAARGAPVVLALENRAAYLLAWFALFRLGVPCVHAGWHSTADELGFLVEDSGARVLLVSERAEAAALRLSERRPDLRLRVVHVGRRPPAGCTSYYELVARAPDRFPAGGRAGQGTNIVYTSGTTGRPKGAMRDFTAFGLVELFRVLERLPLRTGGRHLLVAPLHHSSGQLFTLLATALGSCIYVQAEFDAAAVLRRMAAFRVESVFMVPTMIRRLVDLPPEMHRRHPTPELQALVSGAAPFPHELRRRAVECFGASHVFDFYGATELGFVTLVRGDEMMAKPGSVGRPLPGQEVRIRDHEGRPLPRGQVGVVHVLSAQLMGGYLGTATSRRTTSDSWLTVDDLGWLDEDGALHLAGRARNLVISGGVNIYPVEVEENHRAASGHRGGGGAWAAGRHLGRAARCLCGPQVGLRPRGGAPLGP